MALIYKTQQLTEVYANSGYWADIQNAVDQAALAGGGNVHIPEGAFNFVNVGESWTGARVIVDAGVNLYGAPTERTSGLSVPSRGMNPNGQVIEWKTVLVMPWDTLSDLTWFKVVGSGDPNKPWRFSDIKLVGYPSVTTNHIAIEVDTVLDFRIDHCYFEQMGGAGVLAYSGYAKPSLIRGVVDHCSLVNVYGDPDTIGYGVHILIDWHNTVWEPIDQLLGHYNDYTVFIEDCYFEKWRHCVVANNGGHYVFRHNTIKNDFGFGSIDLHEKRTQTSGRAIEIYDNQLIDCMSGWGEMAIKWRGGGGVAFNNTVTGYAIFAYLIENAEYQEEIYQPHDIWVWNNTLPEGCSAVDVAGNITEGIDYFLRAPNLAQDGFEYTPYLYPHPLAQEEIVPKTPWAEQLEEGTYRITIPPQVQVGSDIYNFKQWEDGSTNPVRTVNLTADMTIIATYELVVPLTYNLTIAATTGGTTEPALGTREYEAGTIVNVTAKPDEGYKFKRFELDGEVKLQNPINVGMDADHTLLAVFEPAAPPISPVIASLFILALLGGVGAVTVAKKGGE